MPSRSGRAVPGGRLRRIARLARIAACAALGREADLLRSFRSARRARVPLAALRETLLQVYLFAGFPRTVNALDVLERARGPLPAASPERLPPGAARRSFLRRRGRALFDRVYGGDAQTVLDRIGRQQKEFRSWILEDAYGKVLARPGLEPAERECLAVALLAVLDLPRQQAAHLRGALRCGAAPGAVEAALAAVEGIAPRRAVAFARARLAGEVEAGVPRSGGRR